MRSGAIGGAIAPEALEFKLRNQGIMAQVAHSNKVLEPFQCAQSHGKGSRMMFQAF
jgi:hypothetical protein